ncbi:uncharacterized protein LOC124258217 [Haliotis rubra]|uniref:uncharacterized protein LOC124258217 n=1 Tax=Haliotis rubra TaxID=36100 RepID=UPI001EE56DE4|nr:uncharacterized protein LOC124258217 [Haliotis rubra]
MLKSGVIPSKFYWFKEVKRRSGLAINRQQLETHIPETADNAIEDPMEVESDADCVETSDDTKQLEDDKVSELQDMLKRCKTVSRKILTWLNYLYFVLGSIPLWLSRQQIDYLTPEDFKPKYSSTRVVLDCTEITCQVPSSMVLNSQAYSNNKDRTPFKSLIGVAPHGAMTFLSPLYTGCMSDNEIVKLCGIRDSLEEGDSVMADKGFQLGRYFAEKNIGLNMPLFFSTSNNGQFTPEQVELNEEIASLRVHVERFNRRVKENHIFDNDIPMSMVGSMIQLWSVACILANFQGPLIAK